MDIETRIKQFVLDNFVYGGSLNEIKDEASFMAEGIIDSLGVLELIAFVEDAFAIEVADEEVLPENFGSVRGMARYIREKQHELATVAA